MLIVWDWRSFQLANKVVDSDLLEKDSYKDNLEDITLLKGDLFDEYIICDQLPNDTSPPITPKALIVRTYIVRNPNKLDDSTFRFLIKLIEYYKTDNSDLYVFLHRRDGFGDTEVRHILNQTTADKCFLIGGGRDNIYYRDIRNQGILGDDGKFYRKIIKENRPAVTVADDKRRKVFQPHFDKIWEHYKHEFHTKIFELKEDLLAYFYQIYPSEAPWNGKKMLVHLAEDRPLYLRIKSFIDSAEFPLTEEEVNDLHELGREDGKAYEFDDCRQNLITSKFHKIGFEETSSILTELFCSPEANGTRIETVNEILVKINNSFSLLLEGFPEEKRTKTSKTNL